MLGLRNILKILLLLFNIFIIVPIQASTIPQAIPLKPRVITSRLTVPTPNDNEKPFIQFGVVSDIHVQAKNNLAQLKFSKMLCDIKEQLKIKTLIINGDLGNGTLHDYSTLQEIVGSLARDLNIYFTIGNHEFYQAYENPKTGRWSPKTFPNRETEQSAIKRFLKLTGQPKVYYDQYISGFHFIFLGSEKSAMSGRIYKDRAYLSNKQLTWLQTKLKENYVPHKPIFVFLHQPFPNSTKCSWYRSIQGYVIQQDQLRTLLGHYPEVIIFSGHTHWQVGPDREISKGPFNEVNDSSVGMPMDSKGKYLPKKSEGLVVTVYKNRVVIKGRDFITDTWISNTTHVLNI